MYRSTKLGASLFAAILTICFVAVAVSAHTYPDNVAEVRPDSIAHDFCFASFGGDKSVVRYGMDIMDSTTELYDLERSSCGASTDIHWKDYDLSGNLKGQYFCVTTSNGGSMCNSADVVLDWAQIDIGSSDWYDRRYVSVHEVGHSIGFGHSSGSAMQTGGFPGTDLKYRRFSSHDIGHVNAIY